MASIAIRIPEAYLLGTWTGAGAVLVPVPAAAAITSDARAAATPRLVRQLLPYAFDSSICNDSVW